MFKNKAYVYEVYKEKSFSKAAENLFISQPALSLTVKKIEKKLGTQLFDRSTTPIQLTESGQEYIRCVEHIMDIESGYQNFLNAFNDLKVGSLIIGASNFFTSFILPPYITRFLSKYPSIRIHLAESDTVTLEKRLFSGELDFIVENCTLDPAVYTRVPFYSEELILASPKSLAWNQAAEPYQLTTKEILRDCHKKPKTPAVPLHLFADAPFILLRQGNDSRSRADRIFEEQSMRPVVVLELDQLATAYHTACHGLGIAVISDTVVKTTLPDSRMVYYKIGSAHAQRENYFYYKNHKYITRAMEEFLHLLRE